MIQNGRQQLCLDLAEAIRDEDWRAVAEILVDLLNNDLRYEDEPKDTQLDHRTH